MFFMFEYSAATLGSVSKILEPNIRQHVLINFSNQAVDKYNETNTGI